MLHWQQLETVLSDLFAMYQQTLAGARLLNKPQKHWDTSTYLLQTAEVRPLAALPKLPSLRILKRFRKTCCLL
jgi:hypothetical protein